MLLSRYSMRAVITYSLHSCCFQKNQIITYRLYMYYFGQEWKIRLSLESKYLYRSPLQQPQPRRPQWSSKWRQRQLRRMRKKAGWLQQRTVVALLSDDALLRDREGLRGEDVLLHWDLKCKKKCVEIQSTKIQSIKIIWHFSYLLIFCFWLLCKNLCHLWNDKNGYFAIYI